MPEPLAGNTVNAQDVVDGVRAIDPVSWTPTWTNLTKGTGPTEAGWYLRLGRLIVAQYTLTVGTSPSWSGIVSFTLPVEALDGTLDAAIGSWMFRDQSTTDWYAGTAVILSATTARMAGAWNGTAPREMLGESGTSPVALAVSDKVSVCLSYLAAT